MRWELAGLRRWRCRQQRQVYGLQREQWPSRRNTRLPKPSPSRLRRRGSDQGLVHRVLYGRLRYRGCDALCFGDPLLCRHRRLGLQRVQGLCGQRRLDHDARLPAREPDLLHGGRQGRSVRQVHHHGRLRRNDSALRRGHRSLHRRLRQGRRLRRQEERQDLPRGYVEVRGRLPRRHRERQRLPRRQQVLLGRPQAGHVHRDPRARRRSAGLEHAGRRPDADRRLGHRDAADRRRRHHRAHDPGDSGR